jgi:uncharacterized protein YgiM (DUF1202 family)
MLRTASWTIAAVSAVMIAGAAQAASLQSPSPLSSATVEAAAQTWMMVGHSYAHLRKEPNTRSPILATLKQGTKVDVIEKVAGGKWAHVKVDKFDGYVSVNLLK